MHRHGKIDTASPRIHKHSGMRTDRLSNDLYSETDHQSSRDIENEDEKYKVPRDSKSKSAMTRV